MLPLVSLAVTSIVYTRPVVRSQYSSALILLGFSALPCEPIR
jgi:hypothetical protein